MSAPNSIFWGAFLFFALLNSTDAWNMPMRPRVSVKSSLQDVEGATSPESQNTSTRRRWVSSMASFTMAALSSTVVRADDDSSDFAALQAKTQQLAKAERAALTQSMTRSTDQTIYDFELPVAGFSTPMRQLIRQSDMAVDNGNSTEPKIKAILFVNIKQDDPVARKTIPELISLATKYRQSDSVAIVCSPTDQGYYEPDTSKLIGLKLQSEYGYGINPATIVTDKVNLLGTGAHPFWRWLQSTCRNPQGLGRIEGNFEKFLVDARTGLPVRRYPRKYSPLAMADDVDAVVNGRALPPAKANFLEAWRQAASEAKDNTYRFEKGLNVFDQ